MRNFSSKNEENLKKFHMQQTQQEGTERNEQTHRIKSNNLMAKREESDANEIRWLNERLTDTHRMHCNVGTLHKLKHSHTDTKQKTY